MIPLCISVEFLKSKEICAVVYLEGRKGSGGERQGGMAVSEGRAIPERTDNQFRGETLGK